MFDRVVTIFNYHKATGKWYGTIIGGCSLTMSQSSADSSMGTANQNSVNINIHCDKNKSFKTTVGSKSYISPKSYETTESPASYVTFKPETDFMVVDGSISIETPESDDDYESGYYNYVNKSYDDVFMVTSSAFYNLLPHFVVGGR